MQPRDFEHRGERVEALRYNPGGQRYILHHLANRGMPCAHIRQATEAIELFSYGAEISISDPRHDFNGADGVIYPGDWVVFRSPWQIEIVPSSVFDAEYVKVGD